MASPSERSSGQLHDKVQRVKWPYLQTHWQAHYVEAPHRTMKKSESSRAYSWWWDSHINPKNSKWLQENLSEMDSKVTAMLKIIEEDADSFSKRAEMYYKRRPELVNLVEEFYRTYRALVERYTFLTREIRQNVAPALQAQLGVSADSAPNSPLGAQVKRSVDGIDISSPSYSYTGGSEHDGNSPSIASYTSWKAPMDEEESSQQGMGLNYHFSSSKLMSLEADKAHEPGGLLNATDGDIKKLQKDLRHLQEENKALSAKALGDVTNLKNLHLELSNLQSKMRSMEAEDKLAKSRLMSVLEQEQKLEAENLKLSHALITAKEEKTGLDELRRQATEERDVRYQRIQELEEEAASLKDEILKAQSQALLGSDQVKKLEEENEKLQQAVMLAQEEREKDSIDRKQAFEALSQELRERIFSLEKDNVTLKEDIATGSTDIKRLEDQVVELTSAKKDLAEELHNLQKQSKAIEQEKHRTDLRSQKLQWELEVARRNGQSLSEQMLQKTAQIENLQKAICELQAESTRLAIQKMEGSKLVIKLEADIQELLRDKNRLIAECQQYESTHNTFKMTEVQFKEQLASKSAEYVVLQEHKSAVEATAAKAELQAKELQEHLSSLYSEKEKFLHEHAEALQRVKTMETHCTLVQKEIEESQGHSEKLKQEHALKRYERACLDHLELKEIVRLQCRKGDEELLMETYYQYRTHVENAELLQLARSVEDCHSGEQVWEMSLREHWTVEPQIGDLYVAPIHYARDGSQKDIEQIGFPNKAYLNVPVSKNPASGMIVHPCTMKAYEQFIQRCARKLAKVALHKPKFAGFEVIGKRLPTVDDNERTEKKIEDIDKELVQKPEQDSDYTLKFCGPMAEISDMNMFFTARTGQIVWSTVKLSNVGSTSLYYSWEQQPAKACTEAIEKGPGQDNFKIVPEFGSLVPGETKEFHVNFQSRFPGTFIETWILRLHPKLTTPLQPAIFHGVATSEDATRILRESLREDLDKRQVNRCIEEIFSEVVPKSIELARPQRRYHGISLSQPSSHGSAK